MKIVTWNVNSIRSRLPRVLAWLEKTGPDIVCLQELKGTEDVFPFEPIREAGYHAAVFGQKTYNGVAILSRKEPHGIARGMADDVDDPRDAGNVARTSGRGIFLMRSFMDSVTFEKRNSDGMQVRLTKRV